MKDTPSALIFQEIRKVWGQEPGTKTKIYTSYYITISQRNHKEKSVISMMEYDDIFQPTTSNHLKKIKTHAIEKIKRLSLLELAKLPLKCLFVERRKHQLKFQTTQK